MSRARKLCEELNSIVKEHGRAYLTYNYQYGLIVTPEIAPKNTVVMAIHDEVSEEEILDHLLMMWEDECGNRLRHLAPRYLWAIRDRLWSDYNVD